MKLWYRLFDYLIIAAGFWFMSELELIKHESAACLIGLATIIYYMVSTHLRYR